MSKLFLKIKISFLVILLITCITNQIKSQSIRNSNSIDCCSCNRIVVERYVTDVRIIEPTTVLIAENLLVSFNSQIEMDSFRFSFLSNYSLIGQRLNKKVFNKEGERVKDCDVILTDRQGLLRLDMTSEVIFPIKVELEYKEKVKSIADLKRWSPISKNDICVLYASLKISYVDTSMVGFVENKIHPISEQVDEDEYHVSVWELNDFAGTRKGNSNELPFVMIIKNQ